MPKSPRRSGNRARSASPTQASPPAIRLKRDIGDNLRRGHPWVFNDVLDIPRNLPPASVVDLLDPTGAFVARGLAEPESGLAFRSLTLDANQKVDEHLFRQRIEHAIALRREIVPPDVTGLRIVHGENDHLPGLQADLYDRVLSLRTDGRTGLALEPTFTRILDELVNPTAIVARNPHAEGGRPRILTGELSGTVEILEHDRRFHVDVLTGQKTGFFLDQRDNRSLVATLAPDRRVLNLFAYTGGFSVAAALAGARRVGTVDISPAAIALAEQNFRLNGIDPSAHLFQTTDAFDALEEAAAAPGTWDVIVVDPPSFASNRRARPGALKAYGRLNRLALQALAPGGWLASASCSSHVSESDFLTMLADAARATGRRLTLSHVTGAGADHPVLPAFPEGRYLTFVLARVV